MTTGKQIKANKTNAQNSMGPKTSKGKKIVSKNALQHGILSNIVVIETEDIAEKKAEFEIIKNRFIDDLNPEGILEEMLIDRIVSTYWRLRRVLKAETGEIRKQTDNTFFKSFLEIAKESEKFIELPSLYSFKDKLFNSTFAKYAKDRLQTYKEIVEKEGYLVGATLDEYINLKSLARDKEAFNIVMFFNDLGKGEIPEQDKEKGKKGLIYLIDKDLEATKTFGEAGKELESMEQEANNLAGHIPNQYSVDRIIRYETALENQLYKAINQFLKLQTLRKGGRVISIKSEEIEGLEI